MLTATMCRRPRSVGVEWQGSWSPRRPVEQASLARLPVVQRLLLTTDGTVTAALAALMCEPVEVRILDQRTAVLADDDEELVLEAGATVVDRTVLLCGAQTGTPLLYGASRIVSRRLPRVARDALIDGGNAIGLVLRACELETFRAPLRVGVQLASEGAALHLGAGLMCRRRYAINAGGQALMIVDEQFPADGFATPR